jgi:hypothetical protein
MERIYPSKKRAESIFYASRNAHKISGVDAEAVPAISSKLAYYASLLPGKESQFQTPEGYRIYKNVPIARTGFQQYLGREIKKNPGYQAEWNIGDEEMVTVYRPIEEVTAPETIASFEGKSVLDEHPADPQILIDALDEYEATSKGHAQNVRVGEAMADGETPLIADLHVKHPELNVKVDGGVRDVSCGYTFRLDKDSDGRYVQRQIRGNHVAIVPKGRAGSEVGIKDAAPKLEIRRNTMSKRTIAERFQALGFQFWAKDAKPDEVADAFEEMKDAAKDEEESKAEAEREEKERKEKAGKDKKKAAKDAHPEGCMCDACKDKRASKDAEEFGDDEMTDSEDEDEDEEKLKKDAKESSKDNKASKDGDEADALILPSDERSESDFKVGDAASLLKMLKPVVAKSGDKGAKDAFVSLSKKFKRIETGVKDGALDPFQELVNISPEGGAKDSDQEVPMFTFFNGVSYAQGVKNYNDYVAARAARK